jgi:hypothetical protein
VTNTRDDYDEGSFRWAVGMCDWYPIVADTVLFAIPMTDPGYDPQTGVWTVAFDAPSAGAHFYTFRNPHAVVDGFSQREYIGIDTNPYGPEIELKGPLQEGDNVAWGLGALADDITIRGLCINRFWGNAIKIGAEDWAEGEINEGCVVEGCYLNTDPTGTRAFVGSDDDPDLRPHHGLRVTYSASFRIGGDGPEQRNVISGAGVEAVISHCGRFELINNIIGLDITGTVDMAADVGNRQCLYIGHSDSSMSGSVVRDNVMAGDGSFNVLLICVYADTTVVTFRSNLIGVGTDGSPHGPIFANVDIISATHMRFEENAVAYVRVFYGFMLRGGDADFNTITRNSVYGCSGLGIDLSNQPCTGAGTDCIDGVYGPGVNEEIDPCYCDSVVQREDETVAYMTCMKDCTVEVFIGDMVGFHGYCPLSGHGDVYSGRTYVGDAEEIVPGSVFSQYRLAISPPLDPGTVLTQTATTRNGSTSEFGCSCTVPMAGEVEVGCRPSSFELQRPAPNPFSDRVAICYHIPEAGIVSLHAYDMGGRCVATLAEGGHEPGVYGLEWPGMDDQGRPLPSGAYVIRMVAEGFVASQPVSIVR